MSIIQYLQQRSEEAILHISREILNATDPDKKTKVAAAVKEICTYLDKVADDGLKQIYIDSIVEEYPYITPEAFEKKLSQVDKERKDIEKQKIQKKIEQTDNDEGNTLKRIPDDATEEYWQFRLFERTKGKETGYWFPQQEGSNYVRLTNFVLTPLFHLQTPEKNVRLVEATGFDPVFNRQFSAILELPSNEMLKKDLFATRLFNEGPFMCEASFSNNHLNRINKKLGFYFRIAEEITALGWQKEGFWAFANKAWRDTLLDYDKYGIVAINEKHYLSPSASEMHKDERDSAYENDKMHSYLPSKITFSEWSKMIMDVYQANGYALIGFGIMTIFVDIVKKYTEAPLWYPYGAKESGKSTLAKSLMALFFSHDFEPFNLGTASTDYAFFNRLERFSNCPAVFNEFDEFGIKDEWFRAFKAVYDGEGRERGRGIRGKTHTQKVRCSVVIIGQYLSSKDDNSVLSRTIPCLVNSKNFSQEEVNRYNKLRAIEQSGLSGLIIEVLQHRNHFENEFKKHFQSTFQQMKEVLAGQNLYYSNRILKNYATVAASVSTVAGKIKIPFTVEEYIKYCVSRVKEISNTMSESNALSDFWKTVEYLLDRNQIIDGFDFRVVSEVSVKLQGYSGGKTEKVFDQPTKVLYLRVNNVYREYSKIVGSITKGKGLNEQTLVTYLKEQAYYIGNNPGMRFTRIDPATGAIHSKPTSSMALLYDPIGVNLERDDMTVDHRIDEEFQAQVTQAPIATTLEDRYQFTVARQVNVKTDSGMPKTETQFTKCYVMRTDQVETDLMKDAWIQLKGKTQVNMGKGRAYRNMDVLSYTVIERPFNFPEQNAQPEPTTAATEENPEIF